ncbi:MAG: hypothetical protein HXX15_01085 [Rhodopseudomonas sp.]|uniref:hypothetical protein n=1 Tax=Rhodopseudomonas sp. TaxID=1078 RepID=UPI00185BF224|nr:hypothetical protein [Rhodopseudomonas sp.]NVN84654.1 hypothetical protein [Rhodopseudomonas sp.]
MRHLTIAMIALALLMLPAQAQMGGGRHRGEAKGAVKKGAAIDEKAYKAALERIPDSKVKVDPWGQMRPSEPRSK